MDSSLTGFSLGHLKARRADGGIEQRSSLYGLLKAGRTRSGWRLLRRPNSIVSLGAGGYIVKPRGQLHSMWNAGTSEARMIEIISPAGFEKYFVELAAAVAAAGGRPDASIVGAVAERFGLSFDFGEVPDLVARYGLIPQVSRPHS